MTGRIEILDLAIVCPFVGNIERGSDGTSVGVDAVLLKEVGVQHLVQVIHRVVEGQHDHLGDIFNGEVTCLGFRCVRGRWDNCREFSVGKKELTFRWRERIMLHLQ